MEVSGIDLNGLLKIPFEVSHGSQGYLGPDIAGINPLGLNECRLSFIEAPQVKKRNTLARQGLGLGALFPVGKHSKL